MYTTFVEQLAKLPDDTQVYPGHDYIENNLRFTLAREPDNADAKALLPRVTDHDPAAALVTTLRDEKRFNTFLRLSSRERDRGAARAVPRPARTARSEDGVRQAARTSQPLVSSMAHRSLTVDETLYRYIVENSIREHPAQAALRAATASHPHAGMQISPDQGQFMALLVRLLGARRTIEIGVFTGYSALCVALALPDDGRVLACDISDAYTRIGRPFWEQAGVAHKIDLRLAPALETLDAELAAGAAGSFDFAFIDADKTGYDAYSSAACSCCARAG